MMGPTGICWAFLLSLVVMSQAKPFYLVYAPEKLIPGQSYNVSVTLMGQRYTQSFVRAMIRNSYNKSEVEVGGTMDSYSTSVFYMYIPEHLRPDQYNLYVTSDGDVNFDDFIQLQYQVLSVSTFIQTDKPIYKPGEIVYFRVFSLNRHLKTVHAPMNISIYDSKHNLLGQWLNQIAASGVISKSFELSDQPLLDEWVIKVWHKGEHSIRTFLVEEYVLPRFEVKTEVTPFLPNFNLGMLHLLKRTIRVKVTARYTQNKPLRGLAVLHINIWSYAPSKTVTKTKEIYGETIFDIRIDDLIASSQDTVVEVKGRQDWSFNSVSFNASVTEDLTDKTIYAPLARTEIVAAPVDIHFTNTDNYFKGGLTSRNQLLITRRDGRPLRHDDYNQPLDVAIKSGTQLIKETTYNIPKDGKVLISFEPPMNATAISIDVTYYATENGIKYKLPNNRYLQPYQTQYGDNIQVTPLTNNATAGDMMKFRVESTQPMNRFIYTITSKGILLSSFEVDAMNQQNVTLALKANYTMCPKANIIVSFVTPQKELLIDSVEFNVQGIFKHSVSVSYNVPEEVPGEEVTLKMTALTGSYVFVGAVDKSVLLLESPNDITYDLVVGSIDKYNKPFQFYSWSISAGNILSRIGLIYMTSFEVHEEERFPILRAMGGEPFPFQVDEEFVLKTSGAAPPTSFVPTESVKVRNFFPETWIWEDVQIGPKGYETTNRVAPGTITTWVTTAFSIHPIHGLAIMRDPVYLRTFQNFYISLDLPYSVIRNEKFKLRIGIFNYLNTTEEVQVILEPSKYYKVYDGDQEMTSNITKFVEVKNNTDIGVDFWLLANETGTISLRVKAISARASDGVQRNLLVDAEGYTVYFNHPMLLNITPNEPFMKNFFIPIPHNIVNGSERIELSVIGDVMGPSLNGLGNLVRMPYGCGEQNMVNFAPNIYIYGYLKNSQLLDQATEANIIRFTKRGYRNELKFRHSDSSYSAFGEKDVNGSTWLTAFVVKCFAQARKTIPNISIEESSVRDSLEWLLKQQLPSGRFNETGKVIHQDMQGGATKDIPMNAYILITLLETTEYQVDGYQQAIQSLANNLKQWIDSEAEKDPYSLAVLLYGMSLLEDDDYFQKIYEELDHKSTKEGGMQYWKMKEVGSHFRSSNDENGNVEISSYVLLAFAKQAMLRDGIPIMRWLVSQRNSMGGYHSTQDTVVSLEALSKFASLQGWSSKMKVDVTAFNSLDYSYSFPTITRDISTMLISHTFPSDSRNLTLTAHGNGTALLQVAWQYNLNTSHIKKHLRLKIVDNSTDKDRMAIQACASWKGQQKSGMVLVEIGIPSGFAPDTDNLDGIDLIRKTEFEGRNLVIYLEELTQDEFCFEVFANRNYLVLDNQPQPIRIKLYYRPDEELVNFYTLESLQSLDIHSWDDVGPVRTSGSCIVFTSLTHLVLLFLMAIFSLLI